MQEKVAWVIKPNKWIDACGVEADNLLV